jgi:hypothetical protein
MRELFSLLEDVQENEEENVDNSNELLHEDEDEENTVKYISESLELYKNRLSSIPAPTYTIPNVLFP